MHSLIARAVGISVYRVVSSAVDFREMGCWVHASIDERVDLLAVRCLDVDGSLAVAAVFPGLVFA